MNASVQTEIQEANAALRALLTRAHEALSGRQEFNFESIQAISLSVGQMVPIVAQAAELRASGLGLANDLQQYTDTLSALQTALEQVRFMLLARKNSLQASRSHLETVNLWVATLNQTR